MAYTPITVTLDPPLVSDPPATFDTKAFQVWLDLQTFKTQANNLASEANNNALSADEDATAAAGSASTAQDAEAVALAAANFVGEWSGLMGSMSVPASVLHDGEYWQLLNDLADVTASEPGVTADWASINASTIWTPISTSQMLGARRYYAVDFGTAPLTLTLPATPSANDFVELYTSAGEATDSVIARNGSTIMGLAEDLTLDYDAKALHLVYNGTDWRVVR